MNKNFTLYADLYTSYCSVKSASGSSKCFIRNFGTIMQLLRIINFFISEKKIGLFSVRSSVHY